MTRAPTWAELRLRAERLSKIHRNCYQSVHQLLDCDVPKIDRKIAYLKGNVPEVISTDYKYEPKLQHKVVPKQVNFYREKKQPRPKNHKRKEATRPRREPVKEVEPPKEDNLPEEDDLPRDDDINKYEFLRPPPLPLSEYLRLNMPRVYAAAHQRAMYIREKVARRKYHASARIINSLQKIKLSPKANRAPRTYLAQREYPVHEYQVKCKLSEKEMRELTARTYKRLPEVKKQRREESTKNLKILNYKNKLEYGRKLLENRRHGIINYPLRGSYDDMSITSSQAYSSLN